MNINDYMPYIFVFGMSAAGDRGFGSRFYYQEIMDQSNVRFNDLLKSISKISCLEVQVRFSTSEREIIEESIATSSDLPIQIKAFYEKNLGLICEDKRIWI